MKSSVFVGLVAVVHACPSLNTCDYPYNDVQTTTTLKDLSKCCPTLPPIPLLNTSEVVDGSQAVPQNGFCPTRYFDTGYQLKYPGTIEELEKHVSDDPPFCPDALYWKNLLQDSLQAAGRDFSKCEALHPFYARYANAFPEDPHQGTPVLGSAKVPVAAMVSAQRTITEMMRQTTKQLRIHCPGCQNFQQAMTSKYARFTAWSDQERSFSNCDICTSQCESNATAPEQMCCSPGTSRLFPSNKTVGGLNCTDDIQYERSQEFKVCYEGKDGSSMPNVQLCSEPGGALTKDATAATEELGLCYNLANGSAYAGYQGRHIILEEWFHTMHGMGIQTVDPEGYAMIHDSAVRLGPDGSKIWMSKTSKGHPYDRYNSNEFEFMAMAIQTWHGFPEWTGYFAYQSRAEIKKRDPVLARLINRFFEDSDWNPCPGIPVRSPRPQTNSCNRGYFGVNPNHKKGAIWNYPEPVVQADDANCSDPCAAAPGSALCGGATLGREYMGPPMEELETLSAVV